MGASVTSGGRGENPKEGEVVDDVLVLRTTTLLLGSYKNGGQLIFRAD